MSFSKTGAFSIRGAWQLPERSTHSFAPDPKSPLYMLLNDVSFVQEFF